MDPLQQRWEIREDDTLPTELMILFYGDRLEPASLALALSLLGIRHVRTDQPSTRRGRDLEAMSLGLN